MAGSDLLRALLVGGITAIAINAPAQAQAQTRSFEIPAGDLKTALKHYIRQSGVQLVYRPDDVRGKSTRGVKGTMSAVAALDQLLSGSGLAATRDPSGAVMVGKGGSQASPQTSATATFATADASAAPDILVVGSRLPSSGRDDGAAPVTIFTRSKIDQLGASDVSDVLKYLPQQSFSQVPSFLSGGGQIVQLRGLAAGTTLILINGRRMVPGAIGGTAGYVDINAIPLASVERVEVLSDSASAIYGADAVGGVVNIVLKSSIDRPTLDLSYGSAAGGAAEKHASFSVGGHTDRARATLVVDYFRRDPLLGAERDFLNDADYRRFGSADRRSLFANPVNICAVSGNLPGLSTPCAAVPIGSTGVGLTPASFAATAGLQNFESLRRYVSIIPSYRSYSATATASYDLTAGVRAFGEFMYVDRTNTQTNQPPTISNGLVSAANPFNPFGVAVRANYLFEGLPANQSVSHEFMYRETAGLSGRLMGWDWELSVLGAQSDSTFETRGGVNATRVSAALAATTTATALNVFADGPGGTPSLLLSLLNDPATSASSFSSDQLQIGGFARGTLFNLPGGSVQLVAGGEWRKETFSALSPTVNITSSVARRTSWSTYGELRVPLLSKSDLPLVHDLAVTVAGRYDHYSDFGSTFNAQYGAEWRPVAGLLLRASLGDAYRAPTLYSLFGPRTTTTGVAISGGGDPRRGGEAVVADVTIGGNPSLQAEKSRTYSFGAVLTPQLPWRPRLTASWWSITQDQRLTGNLTSATLLINEAFFPDRVIRAAPTAADVAAGRPGRILALNQSNANSGYLTTNGLDLSASATIDSSIGTWSPSISATYVNKYDAADLPNAPVRSRAGIADESGSIPRWRAVAALQWSKGGLGASTTVRYVSSYADVGTFSTIPNGRRVASQFLTDLQLSADVGKLSKRPGVLGDGLIVRLGVRNLFNRGPSFTELEGWGYDPTQADLRQRYIYLAVSKAF